MTKRKHTRVVVRTNTGRKVLTTLQEAGRQMGRSSGGMHTQASGKVTTRFSAETGRAAALKRWARHPDTGRGYRLGQRFTKRKTIPRAPLRERYAREPSKGIRYDVALKQWFITDTYSTRPITERTALRRLGYLTRPTDRIVPNTIVKKIGKQP